MKMAEYFELHEGYAAFRPEGEFSLREAGELMRQAILYCREKGIRRLLVDGSRVTGFEAPKVFEQFHMATGFADAAKSMVRVVMVVRPELIDREKFGVTVGQNRGLEGNMFSTEAEALHWLLESEGQRNSGEQKGTGASI